MDQNIRHGGLRSRRRVRRAILAAPLALLAAGLAAPAAGAAEDARFEGNSADGSRAFFSTADRVLPGDTDTKRDIYERSYDAAAEGYVTRQVSLGPVGGNNAYNAQYLANAGPSGEEVFFLTGERLVAGDHDNATDIYMRDLATNKTALVSAGDPSCVAAGCGEANLPADAVPGGGVADEGNEVFFVSNERLSSQDTDSAGDIYVRNLEEGTTTLVSAGDPTCSGSCGDGAEPSFFVAASGDGTRATFTTHEKLAEGDEDGVDDIYQRDMSAGRTRLVSAPGVCPGGEAAACIPVYGGSSSDGSHVFFETIEQLSEADEDEFQDVYDWTASGGPVLVSRGPSGGNGEHDAIFAGNDAAGIPGSSTDGSEVFFTTDEQLTGADEDEARDVYVRDEGSSTELVSGGDGSCAAISFCEKPANLKWVSPDGSMAVLSTEEPLLAADEDGSFDVYARALPGGPTTLVSLPGPSCEDAECGNREDDASFVGASSGGARLFFITAEALAPLDAGEPLVPGDADEQTDVYERRAGATRLVSAGQFTGEGAHSGNGPYDAQLQGLSEDGTVAFLTTDEQLTAEDFDSLRDVYARLPIGTLLVSRGNDSAVEEALAPPAPLLERTAPESPAASTEPAVIGSADEAVEPTASVKIYTTTDCSGEPAATGTVEELEAGIAVGVESGATTRIAATVEAEGFVSACSEPPLEYRQEAPAPPGEEEGGGSGGSGGEEAGSGDGGAGAGGSAPAPSPAPAPAPVPTPAPEPTHDGIAYVTPITRITFGPAFKTRIRRPVFRFTDSTGQPGTRFICRVDRRRWRHCRSPVRLKGLRRGRHVFRVKARNAAGTWEARPHRRRFKMVRGDGRHRKHTRHHKRGRR